MAVFLCGSCHEVLAGRYGRAFFGHESLAMSEKCFRRARLCCYSRKILWEYMGMWVWLRATVCLCLSCSLWPDLPTMSIFPEDFFLHCPLQVSTLGRDAPCISPILRPILASFSHHNLLLPLEWRIEKTSSIKLTFWRNKPCFVQEGFEGSWHAFCKLCNVELSVNHRGLYRHQEADKQGGKEHKIDKRVLGLCNFTPRIRAFNVGSRQGNWTSDLLITIRLLYPWATAVFTIRMNYSLETFLPDNSK